MTVTRLAVDLGVGMPSSVATTIGALLCFGLRIVSLRRGWRLPVAGEPEPSADRSKTRRRA
jgi:uncharacterized membrane protein YeiH